MTEVTDNRPAKAFTTTTYSGYKTTQVKAELARCLGDALLEESLYWSAELVCSGKSLGVWDALLSVCATSVFRGCPGAVMFVARQAVHFRGRANTVGDALAIRNDKRARQLLAASVGAVCGAPRRHKTKRQSLKKEVYGAAHPPHRLKAPTVDYAAVAFETGDPTELFVAVNEMAYALSDQYDPVHASYWIEWALGYDRVRRAKRRPLSCKPRLAGGPGATHTVWLLWDVLEQSARGHREVVRALRGLFSLRFTAGAASRRVLLLYCAVACCDPTYALPPTAPSVASTARAAAEGADGAYAAVLKRSVPGATAATASASKAAASKARAHEEAPAYARKFELLGTLPGFVQGH